MKIYLYCIVYRPNDEEKKDGIKEEIIAPISCCLANDENQARVIAAQEIDTSFKNKLDRIEVAVKPF